MLSVNCTKFKHNSPMRNPLNSLNIPQNRTKLFTFSALYNGRYVKLFVRIALYCTYLRNTCHNFQTIKDYAQ